jgi:hypothetical protein
MAVRSDYESERPFIATVKTRFMPAQMVPLYNRAIAQWTRPGPGRTAAQRNAPVIDRFFESKREALSWANAHPHFMTVRVVTIDKLGSYPRAVASRSAPDSCDQPQRSDKQ